MLTERMETTDENLAEMIDREISPTEEHSQSVIEEPNAVLNIKTSLLRVDEVKKNGNRFLEDGRLNKLF
jgi:hypothetical protein